MGVRAGGPVLFLIPARGGSRRIPGKNLREVAGIPLVGHAVRTARRVAAVLEGGPHLVACSTDDPRIAAAAHAWGADEIIERPARLASDDATSVDVVLHALGSVEASGRRVALMVLLQPTSPLTEPDDVLGGLRLFAASADLGVASVTTTHPAGWHQGTDEEGRLRAVEAHDARHVLNGAFYIADPERFRQKHAFVVPGETLGFEVPAERSVDIDEPGDLLLAEHLAAARPVATLRLGDREIGGDQPFVIAEAGVNHNGDEKLAHRLVEAAAAAGADAVKFQTFDPDALASAATPTADYQRTSGEGADQREMLRRLALPDEAWPRLQEHARECGLVFLSTPFDEGSAGLLDRLDVPAFKVGSGELTNLPFLAAVARFGRPMLVSTGMADMVEVAAAVDTIRGAGNDRLALLHCVSAYPARAEDANLRAIETLRRAFGAPTGWSDHTPGIELPLAAATLGAAVIEKHLTLDRTMPGPDHRASLEPGEFRSLVEGVRTVATALGSGRKEAVAAERTIAEVARRSIHWGRAVPAGHLVTDEDLVALRPGTGLAPGRAAELVGRRTSRSVESGTLVSLDDFAPDA